MTQTSPERMTRDARRMFTLRRQMTEAEHVIQIYKIMNGKGEHAVSIYSFN